MCLPEQREREKSLQSGAEVTFFLRKAPPISDTPQSLSLDEHGIGAAGSSSYSTAKSGPCSQACPESAVVCLERPSKNLGCATLASVHCRAGPTRPRVLSCLQSHSAQDEAEEEIILPQSEEGGKRTPIPPFPICHITTGLCQPVLPSMPPSPYRRGQVYV